MILPKGQKWWARGEGGKRETIGEPYIHIYKNIGSR